jgi:hypothetical protein
MRSESNKKRHSAEKFLFKYSTFKRKNHNHRQPVVKEFSVHGRPYSENINLIFGKRIFNRIKRRRKKDC